MSNLRPGIVDALARSIVAGRFSESTAADATPEEVSLAIELANYTSWERIQARCEEEASRGWGAAVAGGFTGLPEGGCAP